MKRIGIVGGTFNPVHQAHLAMARAARDALQLDLVLMMVASDPPHKQVAGSVPASVRYQMTALACEGEDRIEACGLELGRTGKSYTSDTVLELHRLYPDGPAACTAALKAGLDVILPFRCVDDVKAAVERGLQIGRAHV